MTTVTDNFDRANGSAGAPWGQLGTVSPPPSINANRLNCYGASYQLPETPASVDIDFSITVMTNFASGVFLQYGGSREKYSDTNFDGYYCMLDNVGNCQIFRKKAGSSATGLDGTTGKGNPVTNDILRMTRVGNTISMYKNGVLMLAATDNTDTRVSKGFIGIFSNAGSEAQFDNFTATYTSPPPPGPTLAAVPDPLTGVVNLTVTGATGTITVTRYIPGQPGVKVRGSFANGRVVPDQDAPLNVDIVYIATDTVGTSAQVTVRLDSSDAFLTLMSNPALSARVIVLADDAQEYTGLSTPHKVIASNIPLVTVEPTGLRAGTYRFLCRTFDDFAAVRAIYMTGGVMLLRSPCQAEYFDTSFIMTRAHPDIRWGAAPPRQRVVELDYQAVAPDSTPPTDILWTWADVPAEFATWADVPLTVATWADMVTFDPSA